jgi:mercuric reductase
VASSYELVILGQGSAAFAAAIKAEELGVKTALVGKNRTRGALLGGTCVNVGCVPSKNLLSAGTSYRAFFDDPLAIRRVKTKPDFAKAMAEKDALVGRFRKRRYSDVLEGLRNVDFVPGEGRFISSDEVKVGRDKIKGSKFLIATGARAGVPDVKGVDGIDYLTNEEALSLRRLPRSMIVVGGRALGLEFAQMYAHFGTKMTLLQRSDRILPDHEPEISSGLRKYLEDEGIRIHVGVRLKDVSQKGGMKLITAIVGRRTRRFTAEQVLFATGRTPNTDRLDVERAGVKLDDRGFVEVDSEMQTSAAHIWAAGDVVGEPMLESLAAKEGSVAVNNAFGGTKKQINFDEVPSAVFTSPEVASVGLTEAETERRGIKCACSVVPLELVAKANVVGDTRGLVKMVIDKETKQIIGLHILAQHGADLIHEGVMAVKNRLTIDDVIDTLHVFPTVSESVKLAAQSFYRDVGKMSCCVE